MRKGREEKLEMLQKWVNLGFIIATKPGMLFLLMLVVLVVRKTVIQPVSIVQEFTISSN